MTEQVQADGSPREADILAETGALDRGVTTFFPTLLVAVMTPAEVEPARALLPPSALEMLDALPDVLRNDPTEQLLREAAVVSGQRDECLRAVDAYFAQSRSIRRVDQCKTLAQWEYLTRQMVIAYERELTARMTKIHEEMDDGR